MPEIPYLSRVIVLNEHYVNGISFAAIARKPPGVIERGGCARLEEQTGSKNVDVLIANCQDDYRKGKNKRVVPVSDVSKQIRT